MSLSKIKWFFKKLYIFFKSPLLVKREKLDFDFLDAFYSNNNLIIKNLSKYNDYDLSEVKKLDFSNENTLSLKYSKHLKQSLNSKYFDNLVHFGYGQRLLKANNFKDSNYIENFHLYPANVFVINELIKLLRDKQIGEGYIIDYPSGIGNLFLYLSRIIDSKLFFGIDNFTQIAKEDIDKYQSCLEEPTNIITFEEFTKVKKEKEIDVVISIELNLELIIKNLLKLSPRYLIVETFYVSRNKTLLQSIKSKYSIDTINSSIVVFKKND